jgi:hypothetical protein
MYCATHPNVETELTCSRCGKPICPRCLVQTPVGARCRDCANLRRIPTYDVRPHFLLRAAVAAAVVGAALGGIWYLLSPARRGAVAYVALFIALAIGYGIGETVSWVTNRKRGPTLQGIAAAGVVLAYVVRNVAGGGAPIASNDVFGYVTVGLAIVVAIGRLR